MEGSISGDELTWRPPVAGLDLVFTARELRTDGREITHQEKDETRALCLHELLRRNLVGECVQPKTGSLSMTHPLAVLSA